MKKSLLLLSVISFMFISINSNAQNSNHKQQRDNNQRQEKFQGNRPPMQRGNFQKQTPEERANQIVNRMAKPLKLSEKQIKELKAYYLETFKKRMRISTSVQLNARNKCQKPRKREKNSWKKERNSWKKERKKEKNS